MIWELISDGVIIWAHWTNLIDYTGKEKLRRTLRLKKMLKYRKSGIKTLRFVFRLDNYNIITQVNATEHVSCLI